MKERWTSDKCYGEWGVDGSECSIVKYLSEVENWCPKLPSNQKSLPEEKNNTIKVNEKFILVVKLPVGLFCYALVFKIFSLFTKLFCLGKIVEQFFKLLLFDRISLLCRFAVKTYDTIMAVLS